MVDRALSDFSEAVLGHNNEMKWSLSPEIMTRSVMPVFRRCAEGKLTADQALTVAMDFVAARMSNNFKTCQGLFTVLDTRLEALMHGEILPAHDALKELFLGLNEEMNWTTNPENMKAEMRPTFERVASGDLSPNQAVMVFVDGVTTRNEAMLSIINRLIVELAQELRRVLLAKANKPKAVNGNSEKDAN
jgi:hypothetical protein